MGTQITTANMSWVLWWPADNTFRRSLIWLQRQWDSVPSTALNPSPNHSNFYAILSSKYIHHLHLLLKEKPELNSQALGTSRSISASLQEMWVSEGKPPNFPTKQPTANMTATVSACSKHMHSFQSVTGEVSWSDIKSI